MKRIGGFLLFDRSIEQHLQITPEMFEVLRGDLGSLSGLGQHERAPGANHLLKTHT
jgi:hypothetical protein